MDGQWAPLRGLPVLFLDITDFLGLQVSRVVVTRLFPRGPLLSSTSLYTKVPPPEFGFPFFGGSGRFACAVGRQERFFPLE